MRSIVRRLALLIGVFACAQMTCAQAASAQAVDLQLVLAVDASGSVNTARFELQKQGYVAAFRNPRVLAAIGAGPTQAIAVTMVQWTGPRLQIEVVKWMHIHDALSAEAVAAAIAAAPRQLFAGGTSISGIIDYAVKLFARTPLQGARRVIDISGDGRNNIGRPADVARDAAVAAGITINGLPILNIEPNLDDHYRDQVIGGDGAFLIAIDAYEQFGAAVVRKLITEISGHAPPRHAAARP